MSFSRELIERSGYDRAGFAAHYDRFRPRPPRALLDVLCRYARAEQPALVVDLGCGTGLSTRVWSGVAERVIGIEPNAAMLAAAEPAAGVEYREAYSHDTGITAGAADIVTCSQSLHWMEPDATFAEAARVLRRGGVFAAYDYDWPPVIDPEVDDAFHAYQGASGRFRFSREIVLHSVEERSYESVGGFARSLGLPGPDLTDDELERELRIDELENVARRVLGDRKVPFFFGYRVRVGVF